MDCFESCDDTSLQIHSSNIQAKKLYVGIYNPTNQPQTAFIRAVLESGGEVIYVYDQITGWPNSVTIYLATFQHPIQLLSCFTVCNDPPDAPNEGPDPILMDFEQFGPSKPGGGLP